MPHTRARFLFLALLGCLMLAPALHAQQTSAPLEERMSYAEFRKLGLDKLSPEQLKELNAWLSTHGNGGPAMTAPAAPHVSTASGRNSDKIVSRMTGDFHGWENGTVLTLENGQRWRVSDDAQLSIRTIHEPKVTLTKGFFGTWLLSVEGVDDVAHVTPAD